MDVWGDKTICCKSAHINTRSPDKDKGELIGTKDEIFDPNVGCNANDDQDSSDGTASGKAPWSKLKWVFKKCKDEPRSKQSSVTVPYPSPSPSPEPKHAASPPVLESFPFERHQTMSLQTAAATALSCISSSPVQVTEFTSTKTTEMEDYDCPIESGLATPPESPLQQAVIVPELDWNAREACFNPCRRSTLRADKEEMADVCEVAWQYFAANGQFGDWVAKALLWMNGYCLRDFLFELRDILFDSVCQRIKAANIKHAAKEDITIMIVLANSIDVPYFGAFKEFVWIANTMLHMGISRTTTIKCVLQIIKSTKCKATAIILAQALYRILRHYRDEIYLSNQEAILDNLHVVLDLEPPDEYRKAPTGPASPTTS